MLFLRKLYKILSFEYKKPRFLGFFHLFSISATAFLTTILCKKYKSVSEKSERRIAFLVWLVLAILELYKQFVYLFDLTDEVFSLNYSWNGFPFQLCSAPLYVLPLIAFLPSGKIREAFVAFYGTFVLLGGIAVCVYPGNVFVETLGINLHTMVWHGSQVFLGVYFNLRRFSAEKKVNLKQYFLSAFSVFLCFVAIAMLMNEGMHNYFVANSVDEYFNMFFISPYYECLFPVLKLLQAHTPYLLFLLSYIVILSVFSYILIYAENLIIRTAIKNANKLEQAQETTVQE